MWAGRDAVDRITDYYSYLFTFPSQAAMIAATAGISMAGCAAAFALVWGLASLVRGLLLGLLGLFLPVVASDALVAAMFKGDLFLTWRRFTILSFISSIAYVAVALIFSSAAALTGRGEILVRGIVFAVALSSPLRYLVVAVFSTRGSGMNLAATFLQPALCLAAGIVLLRITELRVAALWALSASVMVCGVQLLVWVMDRYGDSPQGLRLIPLFRALILAWADEHGAPLEEYLARVGEVRDLRVDALTYIEPEGPCRAALVVPYIHPGPFRNVGSSGLPEMLVDRLGAKMGCEVLVAHGPSTHEMDLTSRVEAERVVETVAAGLRADGAVDLASPMVRVERHGAQASCQVFGSIALVTLTLSPKSYDDLPESLGGRIMRAAEDVGLTAVVIDSHNSILEGDDLGSADLESLFEAAVEAMAMANESPRSSFSAGAARLIPGEWGLNDGMGPSGISALAVVVEAGQTCVYVAVDGNNMRSGLRERIVEAIRSRGVDEAEVFTSDTHLVNAIGVTSRGYHPIGEKTDEERLEGYVLDVVAASLSKVRRCNVSHTPIEVADLTVLGEAGLKLLSDVLESAFGLFKRTTLVLAPSSLVLGAVILFLL
ncbi:hypothetical protein AC482_00175 [miscellaneous Crenarchaeota group-15 archaeon DG-45]|uniref:DUF2070 domain-containing protein n=1 Tax=miscellaneous Crenarchaeota group-15 archaeon DG-45 TaxID=1685127 RepID=A0A0M0BSN0_9ARCH|nr:MAG: hypothetical protein AC482_00175 [miscellaneous Crenarchaeota group-15 archaeon DG-45]